MRGIKRLMAGAVLSASFLMAGAAQAMPIPQFDKMTNKQQGEYAVFIVESAANILAAKGDTAGADKVRALFENDPGQTAKPAMIQFVENLNAARKIDQQNASDPNFKPFEVEHALALTLKQNGIVVPVSSLLLASQDYKPGQPTGNLASGADGPQEPAPGSH